MSTPELYLRTGFVLDRRGRIVSTREPCGTSGPSFILVRSAKQCAWAVHADVPDATADAIAQLARAEPPTADQRVPPLSAERYRELVDGDTGLSSGPAFVFPNVLPVVDDTVVIEDEHLLMRHFSGWNAGEIAAGRSPALGILDSGVPVSICFCARRSDDAAAAGVETAQAFRGRGLAPRVVAAWARAVRATGRIPLYSTSWDNQASLAVARKLGLVAYAGTWSINR